MVRVASDEAAAVYVGADSVWTANKPGMVLLTPTSITHAGTSASVGANGQVTFTAVTSLSLNGVFTADFDNYVVSWTGFDSGGVASNFSMKLRASGTDLSGTGYTYQRLLVNSTSVTSLRVTSNDKWLLSSYGTSSPAGISVQLYGPALAQATAFRSVAASTANTIQIFEAAGTNSSASGYDGFSVLVDSGSSDMTGALQVYGVRS